MKDAIILVFANKQDLPDGNFSSIKLNYRDNKEKFI